MITNPRRHFKAAFGSPPLFAYAVLAGVVFLGRELDLVGELLHGSGAIPMQSAMAEFIAPTIVNALIGAAWPRALYATLLPLPFAGVIGGYLMLVLILYRTKRPSSVGPQAHRSQFGRSKGG